MKISKEALIAEIRKTQELIIQKISNQTMLVNSLLEQNYDLIEFECNHNNFSFEDWQYFDLSDRDKILQSLSLRDDEEINYAYQDDNICEYNFEDFKDDIIREAKSLGLLDPPEIYQYFLVDSWLLARLEEKGEIIVNYQDKEQWWGRACCGQSILLDQVIEDIAADYIANCLNIELEEFNQMLEVNNLLKKGWLCNIDYLVIQEVQLW